MIIITVTGIEQLIPLIHKLSLEHFLPYILDVIEWELWRLAIMIQQNPDIPPEYKLSLFLWRNDETGQVGLGVYMPEEMEWLRFGRVLKYKEYVCPVRKYFGGALTLAWTGPDYIKELWLQEKDKILNNIKQYIVRWLMQR
ncbi:MAG: hypothetical protein QXK24_08905 [Ignisphaera sp.]